MSYKRIPKIEPSGSFSARGAQIKDIVKRALREDIGRGDITTKLLFPKAKIIEAHILAGEKGIVCGMNIARLAFKLQDNNVRFTPQVSDGDRIERGEILARIYGKASSILASERVALNFLGMLSGIATRTACFVNKIRNYGVKIMDTRKTLPGLRELEKYAVKIGGGYNHRFRLDEMVLIKDNYLNALSAVRPASYVEKIIKIIKKKKPKNVKLEIEVKNLREFKEALKAKPDIIMLDNMGVDEIKKAVAIKRKMQLEASGNINLKNISDYARSGVDFISLGTLTKDIHSLDLSLEIIKEGR